jgi:hypothetical protein
MKVMFLIFTITSLMNVVAHGSEVRPHSSLVKCELTGSSYNAGTFYKGEAVKMVKFLRNNNLYGPYTFYAKGKSTPIPPANCAEYSDDVEETWDCDNSRISCVVTCKFSHTLDNRFCWP